MITIFEYIQITQVWVIDKLKQLGLLSADFTLTQPKKPEITFAEAVELMRHDSYRRIRGAIRQMGNTVVIT